MRAHGLQWRYGFPLNIPPANIVPSIGQRKYKNGPRIDSDRGAYCVQQNSLLNTLRPGAATVSRSPTPWRVLGFLSDAEGCWPSLAAVWSDRAFQLICKAQDSDVLRLTAASRRAIDLSGRKTSIRGRQLDIDRAKLRWLTGTTKRRHPAEFLELLL